MVYAVIFLVFYYLHLAFFAPSIRHLLHCLHKKLFIGFADISWLQDTNNPLDVSPANPEVSKQRSETEGGAESSSSSSNTESDRQRSSGGGGPRKGSKVA